MEHAVWLVWNVLVALGGGGGGGGGGHRCMWLNAKFFAIKTLIAYPARLLNRVCVQLSVESIEYCAHECSQYLSLSVVCLY